MRRLVYSPTHVAWRPAHEDIVLSAFSATLRTVVVRPGIVYGGGLVDSVAILFSVRADREAARYWRGGGPASVRGIARAASRRHPTRTKNQEAGCRSR